MKFLDWLLGWKDPELRWGDTIGITPLDANADALDAQMFQNAFHDPEYQARNLAGMAQAKTCPRCYGTGYAYSPPDPYVWRSTEEIDRC